MPEVWIPSRLQELAGGNTHVTVNGATIRQVLDNLEQLYPGIKAFLCYGDAIMPGIAVIVDSQDTTLGMLERVHENSEIHFLPALGGGAY